MLADSLFLASISAFLHTSVLLSEVGIAGNSECHRSANKHISMRCVVVAYSSVVSIVMCHVMSTVSTTLTQNALGPPMHQVYRDTLLRYCDILNLLISPSINTLPRAMCSVLVVRNSPSIMDASCTYILRRWPYFNCSTHLSNSSTILLE